MYISIYIRVYKRRFTVAVTDIERFRGSSVRRNTHEICIYIHVCHVHTHKFTVAVTDTGRGLQMMHWREAAIHMSHIYIGLFC